MKTLNKAGRMSIIVAVICASQVTAYAKSCGGQCSNLPSDADCSTYQEQVINGPLLGSAVATPGIVVYNNSIQNCNENTVPGTFNVSFSDSSSISGSVTLGYSTTASVQAGLVGVAQVTAGATACVSASGTITGGSTTTCTMTVGPVNISPGKGVTCIVTATKDNGSWSKTSYVKGYYYLTTDPYGPLHNVTCQNCEGSVGASSHYYNQVSTIGSEWTASCP